MSNRKLLKFNSKVLKKINNLTVNTINGVAVSCGVSSSTPPTPVVSGYLTFSNSNSFTIRNASNIKLWDGTIEYSTDTENWTIWDGTSIISSASDGTAHHIYLRGAENTHISNYSAYTQNWLLTGAASIEGNIENLLDYQTVELGNHPTMGEYCFYKLFMNNKELYDVGDLIIPSVSRTCCYYMFQDCTSLMNSPQLPATTLASACYQYMFQGCSGLITPPQLPATTLANNCYYGMFQSCTSLTSCPQLPVTTLADSCYTSMFQGCTSLTTFSATLSAKTLPSRCCYNMFTSCSNLSANPTISAETLYGIAVENMFGETISNVTTTHANDIYLYSMKELKMDGTINPLISGMAKNVHFGTALTTIEGAILDASLPNLYFHFTDNDTVSFDLTGKFTAGTSKTTKTYNVYTDNTTIKNSALNNGAQYVTMNVYHLNGTPW